jgi:uncharacterized membrane protein YkvA (DUF1232 family)
MPDRHYADPEIIGPEDERQSRVRRGFWATVRKAITAVPFIDEVVASYYCAFDPETPTRVRATLIAALAYFVVPFDVIPDFIAGIGFTDDITVLATAIGLVGRHITERHRAAARRALAEFGGRTGQEKGGKTGNGGGG